MQQGLYVLIYLCYVPALGPATAVRTVDAPYTTELGSQ